MNTDLCKLLYPSRIYCFSVSQLFSQKNYFLLSGCRGHVVLDTKKEIRCKTLYQSLWNKTSDVQFVATPELK